MKVIRNDPTLRPEIQRNCSSLDLPELAPRILGLSSSYEVGDRLQALCVSPLSFPPSVLNWYINQDSADGAVSTNQTTVELSSPLKSDLSLGEVERASQAITRNVTAIGTSLFSVVGLNFIVRDKLLRDNGG